MRRFCAMTVLAVSLAVAAPAPAQDVCFGTVYGLSRQYNPRTGSGFLAVRTGPGTGYRQIGELFNGDVVSIFDRYGNWYHIYVEGIGEGWSHSRWIANECDY
jgi:uncharacterized protein YgiM (DUF1202 family)